jgi:hypothetical protein
VRYDIIIFLTEGMKMDDFINFIMRMDFFINSIIVISIIIAVVILFISIKKNRLDWKILSVCFVAIAIFIIMAMFNSGKIDKLGFMYGNKGVTIEKIQEFSAGIAEVVAVNLAWSGARLTEEQTTILRMEKGLEIINSFLAGQNVSSDRKKEITKELRDMIEHDKKRLKEKSK